MFNGIDFESGVATGGGATSVVDTTRDEPDDYFNGWRVDIIAGTGRGSYGIVTDYTGSTGTFTVADWLNSLADPAAGSIYFVQPANNMHPAGAKFDEVIQASCLAEAEQFFENISAGYIERYTQKALPKAYEADARSKMFVKIGSQPRQERTWSLVEKEE
jgi:hypothetical protein